MGSRMEDYLFAKSSAAALRWLRSLGWSPPHDISPVWTQQLLLLGACWYHYRAGTTKSTILWARMPIFDITCFQTMRNVCVGGISYKCCLWPTEGLLRGNLTWVAPMEIPCGPVHRHCCSLELIANQVYIIFYWKLFKRFINIALLWH